MATIRQYENNNIVITEGTVETMLPTGVVPQKRGTDLYFLDSELKTVKTLAAADVTAVTDRDGTTTNIDSIDTLYNTLRDSFFFRVAGTGGGLTFNPNFIFSAAGTSGTDFGPAEAARDAYFVTNPGQLRVGVLVVVVNTQPDPDVGRQQIWTGTSWVNSGDILTGDEIAALLYALNNTNRYTDADLATVQSISSLSDGRVPVASGTTLIDSSIEETTAVVTSIKPLTTPPSEIRIGAVRLRNSADIIYLQSDLTSNRFFPCGSPFTNSGTGDPVCVNLENEIDITAGSQTVNTDTITLNTGDVMSFPILGASSGVGDGRHVDRSFTVDAVTTGTIRLELFIGTDDTGGLIVDQTVVLSVGSNTIELVSYPLIMVGQSYFVRYTAQTDNIQLRGDNSGPVFVPFFTVRGWPYSTLAVFANVENQFLSLTEKTSPAEADTLLIEDSEDSGTKKRVQITNLPSGSTGISGINVQDEGTPLATAATTLNFVGAGVTVTGTGATKTVTIPGGGTGVANPSFHEFSITTIPNRVDLNTNLNVSQTISFSVTNHARVQSATVQADFTSPDDFADVGTLTVPTIDGTQTQQVTFSSITTDTEKTIGFRIRSLDLQGSVHISNEYNVEVRTLSTNEFAYYGIRSTNDFSTVGLGLLTSVDVTTSGTQFSINEANTNGQFLGILTPDNRDPVSILDSLNQPSLSGFTATNNVRTENGQSYNLYTLQNNSGFDGTFVFTVTTE